MEKVFVVKVREEEITEPFIVPMHPEFICIKKISDSEWMARDTGSQKIVYIKKKNKGKFVEFIFS